ncbi:MAG: ABC transporter permease [Caldilinea sp. CFX5]|nr:ABC transporter permease [Caldilinea sp. CFX5]
MMQQANDTVIVAGVAQLVQAKDLLWAWTRRGIQSRYQQSLLGGLWIIAQPLATVAVFSTIFTLFVPVDTGAVPYPVFSYAALAPWLLLANGLSDMADSLVNNMHLITKIYFPREILPLASLLARFLDFLVASVLLVVLLFVFQVTVSPVLWLFLPLIILIQLALMLGLGFMLAAANVFYRDVRSLLTLGLQLWFYASPIIYSVEMVPPYLRPFYLLNPMASILEAYRAILLYGVMPSPYLLFAGVVALLLLGGGYWYFKRVEFEFADVV